LNDFICRLLSKDPDERFDSAQSVQESLTQYLAHLQNPTQHRLPQFAKKSAGKSRGRSLFTVAGLAVALVLTLALTLPAWLGSSGKAVPSPAGVSGLGSADEISIPTSSPPTSAFPVGGANLSQRSMDESAFPELLERFVLRGSDSVSLFAPKEEVDRNSFRQTFERFNRELIDLEREILEMEASLKIEDVP
jgi:serine/threonine protein kinase